IGEALVDRGNTKEGEARLRRCEAEAEVLARRPDGLRAGLSLAIVRLKLANIYAKGDIARAGSLADAVTKDITRSPGFVGTGWNEASVDGGLGKVYARLGRWNDARTWLEKSARAWRAVHAPKALESRRKEELDAVEMERQRVSQRIQ